MKTLLVIAVLGLCLSGCQDSRIYVQSDEQARASYVRDSMYYVKDNFGNCLAISGRGHFQMMATVPCTKELEEALIK